VFDEAKKKALDSFGGFVTGDFFTGVRKMPSGKCKSEIKWDGKTRVIGRFDTPEQASAAFISVRKDLDDANISTVGTDEVDAIFDAAKKKAIEAVGGLFRRKRGLPRGVYKLTSGQFKAGIKFGGKKRYIGTFDTSEQASAAFISVRKDLDEAKLRNTGESDEAKKAIFDAAKKKALEVTMQ
jgi:hypothetical protein